MNDRNERQDNYNNEQLPGFEEVKSNSDADNDNIQMPNPLGQFPLLTASTLADIQRQLGGSSLNNQASYLSLLQQGRQQLQVGSFPPGGAGVAQGSPSSSLLANAITNILGALQQPQISAHPYPSSTHPSSTSVLPLHYRTLDSNIGRSAQPQIGSFLAGTAVPNSQGAIDLGASASRTNAARSVGPSAGEQQVIENEISQRTQLQQDQLLNLLRSTNLDTLLNSITSNNVVPNASLQRTQLQQDQLLNLLRSTNLDTLLNSITSNNVVPNAPLLPSSTSSPWLVSGGGGAIGAAASLPGGLAANDISTKVAPSVAVPDTKQAAVNKSQEADGSSDEAPVVSKPPARAHASIPASASASTQGSSLVLYMDGDEHSLTEYQCLLRKQLEIFEAGPRDVRSSSQGRNTPILLGQVGLRCRHCASLPVAARTKGAIYFSQTIDGIYQIAQNMSKVHLCERCYRIPDDIQRRLVALRSDCRRASGGKEYWAEGMRALGVYQDGNILRMRKSSSSPSSSKPSSSSDPQK